MESAHMSTMLEATGLNKRFGAVVAAADINIRIGQGERGGRTGRDVSGACRAHICLLDYLG
jgi:ABC-type branched-subunit amino acid transport system ATPase component